jgi:ferredoxin
MIDISDKAKCSGCIACAAVCPHNAIEMKLDVLGFPYPSVDRKLCADCVLCERACVFNDDYPRDNAFETPLIYPAPRSTMPR